MKQVVIIPGGFHPYHAGHYALYQQAVKAFPGADVYVAATADTSTRPFPFPIKQKLAQLAGVPADRFVQVKSPFSASEITAGYDPNDTVLIFVRSEKDRNSVPQPAKRDAQGNLPLVTRGPRKGQPVSDFLQFYPGAEDAEPMSKHVYIDYLPTVEFGPGMTSATEIRNAWPKLNEKRKTALVMSLYPKTQTNPKLAANVVKMLDTAIGTEVDEGIVGRAIAKGKDWLDRLDGNPNPNNLINQQRREKQEQLKKQNQQQRQQGVAEAAGLYGPFTVTINTGERPQSRTKTKKFRREDDAILWAEDWLEDFSQYSFATAQVTDPDGNVVWTTDEQGVSEGSDNITAVFSGYSNYMKGRGTNVFKHYGITVLDKQYFEDEDIAEYTVSGSKEALDQARAYLERSDQFGGMILKQGVAESQLDELRLFHPADNPGNVDVYYRPVGQHSEQRRVVAKNIPYRGVELLTKAMAKKFGIEAKDLEIVPVDQPHGERLNEFAPSNGDDDKPTAEYEVYQCNPQDQFDWIGGPLMQTDDMGKAHSFAYFLWKKHPDKCFMIWQERSQGSRGGYGPEDSVLAPSKDDLDETALRDKQGLDAKRKALQDMEREPGHDAAAIRQRKLDLEKEARARKLNEFAPDEGGESRKFIPWPEFIDAVKQIVGKDFSVTEKVVKSTIQDRFIPHDPMEYGPTMLYSYYEARAGRNKGAVSTRGSIQVGKYYPNNTALGTRNFITSFNLLKGHPFERHFDLTFDNIYKIANIIMGNTEGAFQMPQPANEDYVAEKK